MRLRLLGIFTAVSLLLAVALAGLWGWSYFRSCAFGYYAGNDNGWYWDYYLFSHRGRISYTWFRQSSPSTDRRDDFLFHISNSNNPNNERWPWLWAWRDSGVALVGFHYEHMGPMSGGGGMGWRTISVPDWFLVAVAMIAPIVWFRRRQRFKAGMCAVCGYDLRASPDRCPECGTAVAA